MVPVGKGTGIVGDVTPIVANAVATGGMVGTIVVSPVGTGRGIVGHGGGMYGVVVVAGVLVPWIVGVEPGVSVRIGVVVVVVVVVVT
jgi:hypothetical protein